MHDKIKDGLVTLYVNHSYFCNKYALIFLLKEWIDIGSYKSLGNKSDPLIGKFNPLCLVLWSWNGTLGRKTTSKRC